MCVEVEVVPCLFSIEYNVVFVDQVELDVSESIVWARKKNCTKGKVSDFKIQLNDFYQTSAFTDVPSKR